MAMLMGAIAGVIVLIATIAAVAQGVATGTVRGNVRSAKAGPLAGVRVVVASRADSAYSGTATSDAAGNFSVASVPVGGVTVTAYNAERVIARSSGAIDEAGETISVNLQTP
jgi:hypothetical protein